VGLSKSGFKDSVLLLNYCYIKIDQWQKLTVRNTPKGKLTGYYHFTKVYIRNKAIEQIEQRLLVIRKTFTSDNELDIKFSFTNANMEQYTPEVIAYMQAQRFFC